MKGKTHSTEEIIRILRQAGGGETAQSVCREHNIGVTPNSCSTLDVSVS